MSKVRRPRRPPPATERERKALTDEEHERAKADVLRKYGPAFKAMADHDRDLAESRADAAAGRVSPPFTTLEEGLEHLHKLKRPRRRREKLP